MLAVVKHHIAFSQRAKTAIAVYDSHSRRCLQTECLSDALQGSIIDWSSSLGLLAVTYSTHHSPASELWLHNEALQIEQKVGPVFNIRVLDPARCSVAFPPQAPQHVALMDWESRMPCCWTRCGTLLVIPCGYGCALNPQIGIGIVDPNSMAVVYTFLTPLPVNVKHAELIHSC